MARCNTLFLLFWFVLGAETNAQSVHTGAFLSSVQTGRALDPVQQSIIDPTAHFSTSSPQIHVSAWLENAPDGTNVKAVFLYVEDGEIPIADAAVDAGGNRYVSFTLSRPQNGWAVGRYAVSLLLDGREVHQQSFTVSPPSGAVNFSDPEFGIGFDVPAAWTRSVTADGDYLFSAHPGTEQEGLRLRVQFVIKALNPGSSLLAQADKAENQLSSDSSVKRIFREKAEVAGQTAPYFIAALEGAGGARAGSGIGYTLVILEGPSYYYWISFHGPGPIYKAHHELFEAILGTIEIS